MEQKNSKIISVEKVILQFRLTQTHFPIALLYFSTMAEMIRLKVFSSIGIEIVNREIDANEKNIEIDHEWTEGIYMIHMISSDEIKSYKVKKE